PHDRPLPPLLRAVAAISPGQGYRQLRLLRNRAQASLAQPFGSLRQRPDAVESLPRGDIERALVGAGEGDVRALARASDAAEVFAGLVEHLHADDGRDVDAILAIDRHAVC